MSESQFGPSVIVVPPPGQTTRNAWERAADQAMRLNGIIVTALLIVATLSVFKHYHVEAISLIVRITGG